MRGRALAGLVGLAAGFAWGWRSGSDRGYTEGSLEAAGLARRWDDGRRAAPVKEGPAFRAPREVDGVIGTPMVS